MWVFDADGGFVSVVQDFDSPNQLVIRARDEDDLRSFVTRAGRPKAEIVRGAGTDYPFRARLGRRAVEKAFASYAKDITYTNYKDSVKVNKGGERAGVYTRVWSALLTLDPKWWSRRWGTGWGGGTLFSGDAYGADPLFPDDEFDDHGLACGECGGTGEIVWIEDDGTHTTECDECGGTGVDAEQLSDTTTLSQLIERLPDSPPVAADRARFWRGVAEKQPEGEVREKAIAFAEMWEAQA